MKHLNKLASVFCVAAMALTAMTGCEGSDMFSVNSPDWISEKIDSINAAKGNDNALPEGEEDVYTVGATDYTSGFWTAFSKYYVIPDGKTWNAVFNLNINPSAPNTYKNFALVLCSDDDRGGANYKEYGAIRFDNQPEANDGGNSEWGDYIDRSLIVSNLTFATNTDEGVQKLGGTVILTVDRSDPNAFSVKITNGTVTKTYKQATPLPNLNPDASDTNIRAFLVPEGSYINFLQSNLEPIGGFTSAEDKQPLSMELHSVPKKVMVGTSLEDAMANVSATITFETGITKEVPAAELGFVAVPNMDQVGVKTLVAIYNKTFKNENCSSPITGQAQFSVVDKMFNSLGAADNSTPFFGVLSDPVKVAPNETQVMQFTNYTNGGNNWENFLVVMVNGAGTEYGVTRADCFGWGTAYDGKATPFGAPDNWATWLADMDGAKVTLYTTNNGDGTVDIKYDILAANGHKYHMGYTGISGVDPNDFFVKLSLEKAHLEFDTVIGNEDNTSAFFGALSNVFDVPAGKTVSTQFVNYTSGASNWHNFVAVLVNKANDKEYAAVRADNYGWGTGYDACTHACSWEDWGAWLTAMDGAKVQLSVTNVGDGTANIKASMIGSDGVLYTQTYNGINNIDANDLAFKLTMEKAHLVFDLPFANSSFAARKHYNRAHRR